MAMPQARAASTASERHIRVPVVGVGRKKLRNQVAVSGVYLYRVESRLVSRVYGTSEILGHLPDLAASHAPYRGVCVEVEAGRSADRHLAGSGPVGHVSAVADLNGGGAAFVVDGVGNVAQAGNDLGPKPQLLVERQSAAADGSVGQRGHAHAAAGHGNVVLLELFGGAKVLAHRLKRGGTDRAVAQRDGAEFVWCEKV